MKYTKVIAHEEKSADSERVRWEERTKFSWKDFCFPVLGSSGQKHKKNKKIKLNYYK